MVETEIVLQIRKTLAHLLTQGSGSELLEILVNNGWSDLLDEETNSAIAALFEEQGAALSVSPALDTVVLYELGLNIESIAVLYPALSSANAGLDAPYSARAEHADSVQLSGVLLAGAERAKHIAIPTLLPSGDVSVYLAPASEVPIVAQVDGLDTDLGMASVRGELPFSTLTEVTSGAWSSAVAGARRALSYELIGLTEKLLSMGVTHVTDRQQFGRAIGSFQAVQHRLADVYVDLSSSRLAAEEAGMSKGAVISAVAKSQAGQAALLAATHVQQVSGAMGWTWEYKLHHYVRRAYTLDALMGSADTLHKDIAGQLMTDGCVPRLGSMT